MSRSSRAWRALPVAVGGLVALALTAVALWATGAMTFESRSEAPRVPLAWADAWLPAHPPAAKCLADATAGQPAPHAPVDVVLGADADGRVTIAVDPTSPYVGTPLEACLTTVTSLPRRVEAGQRTARWDLDDPPSPADAAVGEILAGDGRLCGSNHANGGDSTVETVDVAMTFADDASEPTVMVSGADGPKIAACLQATAANDASAWERPAQPGTGHVRGRFADVFGDGDRDAP